MSDFDTNNITQNQEKSSVNVVTSNNAEDTVADRLGTDINEIIDIKKNEILYDFLILGGLNVLAGQSSAGKTLIMYYIAVSLIKSGKNVVYIDFDNPVDIPSRRGLPQKVRELGAEKKLSYVNITKYVQRVQEHKKGYDKMLFLSDIFASLKGIEKNVVVVLDNLQNFIKKTVDEAEMGTFINFLKEITTNTGLTIILVHHFSRVEKHIKGDSKIIDLPDAVYTIKDTKKEGNEVQTIELQSEKQKYSEMAKSIVMDLQEDFNFVVTTDINEKEREILVVIKSLFNRFSEIQQKELKERVRKAVRIGGNNLHIILQQFVEKGILSARHEGKKLFYSLNDIQDNNQTIKMVKDNNDNGNGKALSETTETTEIINNGNGGNGSIKENTEIDTELVNDLLETQIEHHL